jgi:hypothetical protein
LLIEERYNMKFKNVLPLFSALVILSSMMGVMPAGAAAPQAGGSFTRQISSSIVTSFPSGNPGADVAGVQMPEIADEIRAAEAAGAQAKSASQSTTNNHPFVGRSETREHGDGNHGNGPLTSPNVRSSAIAGSNPGLFASFNGLNLRDQRLANGGNQFTVEPPDQGLCAGNGYILESVNDVLRVYDTSGNPLTGVIDLNTFYGYPAQFDRTTGDQGPFTTDPSCYYDTDAQRWFQVILTLDVDPPTGNFLGSNHIDIAVSTSSDPTGSWVVYRLPVQDDGTDGTPVHACTLDGVTPGPCIGDYPHIGADKYGFYVTTNEYSLFGPEFTGAQIYAFSKAQLASNAASVTVVQFDTNGTVNSAHGTQPGFTVWPATSPAGAYSTKANGTEFFLSSNAGEEANGAPGGSFSNELITWALTNTKSLNSASPNLNLSNKVVRVETYGIPPKADQKAGDVPLADCLNLDCFGFGTPPTPEVESPLDANDTRMQQVWYADGKLWGSLDTIVTVGSHGGQDKAGIAYFVISPNLSHNNRLDADIVKQGYVAVAGNNVTYPAISVLPNGKGVMAFTLVGRDYYPSAAYVSIDKNGTGSVHVAAAGFGPQDGFSGYFIGGPRPRWGDYGAAVTDGNKIWFASEYIAQTCTTAQYLADTSCGGTRVTLGNWATRISGITP